MKIKVCALASEVAPLSKTGGLADVACALVKFLHGAGHDARLFTPFYSSIDRASLDLRRVPELDGLEVEIGAERFAFAGFSTPLPGSGATLYLLDCPALYDRATLYTADPDEHVRFLAFTRAALEGCRRLQWAPQIVHCNDWHTGFAPLYLKTRYAGDSLLGAARTVLTIHNIGYQGIFEAHHIDALGLASAERRLLHQDELRAGRINPLRHGIMYADALTTVSPTHAREICSPEYGMGLDDSLRARANALTGILNGVDYDEWDPRHDRYITWPFDAEHLEVKADLKLELAGRVGLALPAETPVAGIVTRLALQKGIELLFDALPKLLARRELGLIALGSGEPKYESFFAELAQAHPERVYFRSGYDEELAHWIEAACDFFLMPSLYEPCGLNQMYSLRYGTVPVVRRTGGLADSVMHYNRETGQGTGIVFNDFNAQALEWALHETLDLYAAPDHWLRLVRNGMRCDFSWQRQGEKYLEIYERLTR